MSNSQPTKIIKDKFEKKRKKKNIGLKTTMIKFDIKIK